MTEDRVFEMVSKAQEFDQIKVSSHQVFKFCIHIAYTCDC